jgi:O-antigen/teichoic acid export membrane protein
LTKTAEGSLNLDSRKEYGKFTKDVAIIGIGQFSPRIKSIFLIPIITKALGASIYGAYSLLMITVDLLSTFSLLGLLASLTRFLAGEKKREVIQEGYYSTLFFVIFSSVTVSFFLFYFSQVVSSLIFREPIITSLLKIGVFLIPLQAVIIVNYKFFTAFRKMSRYAVSFALQNFGETLAAALVVLGGYGIREVLYSFIAVRMVIFIVTFVIIVKEIGIKSPRFTFLPQWLKFSLPLMPSSIFVWLVSASDRYLIAFFLNSLMVGIYSAAYGIASILSLFVNPIRMNLAPTLSKLWDENRKNEVKAYFNRSIKYFLMLAIPSAFGLTFLSRQILTVLSRPEIADRGVIVVALVAGATILNSIFSINGQIYFLLKKTKAVALILFISAVVNIVLNIFLIPFWHINGAALSTLIAYFIPAAVASIMLYKELKIFLDLSFLGKSILSSSIMIFFINMVNSQKALALLPIIIFGAGVYFVSLLLLRGIERKEMEFFLTLFSNFFRSIITRGAKKGS